MMHLPSRGFALLVGLLPVFCWGAPSAQPVGKSSEASSDMSGEVAADITDDTIKAVWKAQRLTFRYQGDRSFYSCSALVAKIGNILLSIGAREDVHMSRFACDEGVGLARFEVEFYSPDEATSENVEALTTYSAEDELLARTRGETLPSASDLPRFPAQWREVSFSRDRRIRFQPSDCELAKAVRQQILSRMSVRIIRDRILCSPSGNANAPRLIVAALVPVRGID
jgi:hypothetical protein